MLMLKYQKRTRGHTCANICQPTIGQCLNGGYGWLEVECHRCKTRADIPLDAIRRPPQPVMRSKADIQSASDQRCPNTQ